MSEGTKSEILRRVMWAVKNLGHHRKHEPKGLPPEVPAEIYSLRLKAGNAVFRVFWVEELHNLRIRATVHTPGKYPDSLMIYDYFPRHGRDTWHTDELNDQLLDELRRVMLLEDIAGVAREG